MEKAVAVGETPSALVEALNERICMLTVELNNDLGVISGHCQLLLDHADSSSECGKRLRQILLIVNRMATRINRHECRGGCASTQRETYEQRKPVARASTVASLVEKA